MASTSAIVRRTLVHGASSDHNGADDVSDDDTNTLRLAFLGCEALPPYGPYLHTAELFADLIAAAYSEAQTTSSASDEDGEGDPPPERRQQKQQRRRATRLVLEVFGVSQPTTTAEIAAHDNDNDNDNDDGSSLQTPSPTLPSLKRFPPERDLDRFDGVILPGSFASAYDTTLPWVEGLADWIQHTLVDRAIPTLGVCFGHQLYAHSFSRQQQPAGGGTAVRCPSGPQAGRRTTTPTDLGRAFLGVARSEENGGGLDLLYTHGDMVENLPLSIGVSLGGNDAVPIQAALYVSSPGATTASEIEETIRRGGGGGKTTPPTDGPGVIAVTFQAHPEFAASNKGDGTYREILEMMHDRGDVSDEDHATALDDADANRNRVRQQSLDAMVAAGRLLGWFPY